MSKPICPICKTAFNPLKGRAKRFCSERCRKIAENRRRGDRATQVANPVFSAKISQQNQEPIEVFRGEVPSFEITENEPIFSRLMWVCHNEITYSIRERINSTALGWIMYIPRQRAWFGRVRDKRGHYSFGPTIHSRARKAVEAWLRYEPIKLINGEKEWSGDCWHLL